MRAKFLCTAAVVASLLSLSASGTVPTSQGNLSVSVTGWPNITGLTVLADGKPMTPVNGLYAVKPHSRLTFIAAGIELNTVAAKSTVTLFDLLPKYDCDSSSDLGKLVSLLLSLDSDQDATNGISLPTSTSGHAAKLSALSESALLALETQLAGHSVSLNSALLTANAALDQETWTESLATRTAFNNDMSVLQSYLDRVQGEFAFDSDGVKGFAYLAPAEAVKIPATLKNEGMAFDGNTPIFSWRYGLQRTDARSYQPTLSYPLALPPDIQAVYSTIGNKPDYGHIGDIDVAHGKLYAPIEDEDNSQLQSYIAIYDPKTLQYTGEKHLLPAALHSDGVPWVAVDAKRNVLYTVTWSGTPAGSLNVFDLSSFALIRTVPLQMSFNGRRVQGAKVHNGMIYATGDSHDAGTAPSTNRKYLYKVDPVSGSVITVFTFDEPNRTEVEGLAFDPADVMHVIVLAPYTTPLYASGTNNPKPFDGSYSIDGDDWNPAATLRHYSRTVAPLREQLCTQPR